MDATTTVASLLPVSVAVVLVTGCGSGASDASAVTSSGTTVTAPMATVPPPQPVDATPINGETYYVVNQSSGLQVDLNNNSTISGDVLIQQPRSFTSTSQRWAFTRVGNSVWKITNVKNGLCIAVAVGVTEVQQYPCDAGPAQQWLLTATSNGYYTIASASAGMLVDTASSTGTAQLTLSAASGVPAQSQQWLLRPSFLRGVDNALLEKQESARALAGLTWWKDGGQVQDVLAILKAQGVNMIRLRPSSSPPYADPSQAGCAGNLCYAEIDAQDLDLARRARNLGLSLELTLLFDGGNSMSVPSAWAGHTLAQLKNDIYGYVKQELLSYRQAGVMPDIVAVGNEVDTGFLGSNSPTGTNFSNFAALQIQALQAIADAAADTSIGPAIPGPLTCLHITPAWDLSDFFTLANQSAIQYDLICQSYYPLYHGPLTAAQAAAANPNAQPVEQSVLTTAASTIGKPIFIIETGEHYESGSLSNDPWYSPPGAAIQRQFLIDLQNVQRALPGNLGMGFEYWDAAGVTIVNPDSGVINGDNRPDAIYAWNGLTLFDSADSSGTTDPGAANYSASLPGLAALGGKLDPGLHYKFINRASGQILAVQLNSAQSGAPLSTAMDPGIEDLSQQWTISSNGSGYFQIANLNPGAGAALNVLDNAGALLTAGNAIVQSARNGSAEQEWDIVSAGAGYFTLINQVSGLAMDTAGGVGAQTGLVVQEPANAAATTQQWQIVAVH